jgi:hypothetical protein
VLTLLHRRSLLLNTPVILRPCGEAQNVPTNRFPLLFIVLVVVFCCKTHKNPSLLSKYCEFRNVDKRYSPRSSPTTKSFLAVGDCHVRVDLRTICCRSRHHLSPRRRYSGETKNKSFSLEAFRRVADKTRPSSEVVFVHGRSGSWQDCSRTKYEYTVR